MTPGAFLEAVQPGGPWLITAVAPGGALVSTLAHTPGGVDSLVAIRAGANLYWTPALLQQAPASGKPSKGDIAGSWWHWVDLDPPKETADLDAWRANALARLQAAGPTIIVDSGRGYWGLWQRAAFSADHAEIEGINRALGDHLGADHCWNVDRLARLPGTVNSKTGRRAEVLDWTDGPARLPAPAAVTPAAAPADWTDLGVDPSADDDLIARALAETASPFGDRVPFAALWNADADALASRWPARKADAPFDRSEADMSLASRLMRMTSGDCARTERIMRRSELARGKWDRANYLRRTILKAVRHADAAAVASQPNRVAIGAGRTAQAVDEVLAAMRERADVFDLGGAIVRVDNGRTLAMDRHSLSHFLGSTMQFIRFNADGTARPDDPPQRLVDQVLSLGTLRGLKPLEAVTTIPTLRPDGSVLEAPGYDEASRLLYVPAGAPVAIGDDVRAGYETLLHPFRDFPFVAQKDWAVILAALLTAVVRPAIPTAPGFAFDAPTRGSGKSLLAKCVAMLASGDEPEPWPHVERRDDEEIRKRLFASLRAGARVVFWDNLTGVLDSPSLAAFLTSSRFQDRILGRSETLALPNRAILLLSANNMTLAGDMPRRVLTCRIDPRMERAYTRQFEIDPLDYVREHRQRLASAALTIVRAGVKLLPGRVASFERWDDLVRQPIGSLLGIDLMDAFTAGHEADPEREALVDLLTTLRCYFGDGEFTAADVADVVGRANRRVGDAFATDTHRALAAAIVNVAGRDNPSTVSIGKIFNFRRDRVADGMRLECRQERNVKRWFVGMVSG